MPSLFPDAPQWDGATEPDHANDGAAPPAEPLALDEPATGRVHTINTLVYVHDEWSLTRIDWPMSLKALRWYVAYGPGKKGRLTAYHPDSPLESPSIPPDVMAAYVEARVRYPEKGAN